MTLYHFTPAHMKDSILREGLRKVGYPMFSRREFVFGVQWLTAEKDPHKQSWATSHRIPYSRTAYRLTLDIPENRRGNKLLPAREWVKQLPEEDQPLVLIWEGSEDWYVYLGNIPPKWIVGCRRMEEGGNSN